MWIALRDGFRAVRQNWGLLLLLLGLNLGSAALLAVPLARQLEGDLAHTGASVRMMYGFDYGWWSRWSEDQRGWTGSLGPEILGVGFVFKNIDLLLRGHLPAGLFAWPPRQLAWAEAPPAALDPLILGLALVYLLLQVFLTGGLLGVFRAPGGGWTLRGLVHGSGFYFGRLLRVSLLGLLVAGVVFGLSVPLSRWVDLRAREAVSESTALALSFTRYGLLLLALLMLNMVSSYAKVILVLEERSSAILAFLSSLGFCLRNLLAAFGQYLAVAAAGLALVAAWSSLDGRWPSVGYKTQLLTLALFQLFMLVRLALRTGLLAAQLELYRARAARP